MCLVIMMLNKYELKDLAMIRLIAERAGLQAARRSAAEWIRKAGNRKPTQERRKEALESIFGPTFGKGGPDVP